ncbi:MAG: amidase family protein [Alphaproteobacteria bacterium]
MKLQQKIQTIRQISDAFMTSHLTARAWIEEMIEYAKDEVFKSVFCTLSLEQAPIAAGAADKRRLAGKRIGICDGIPIVWKDVFAQKGFKNQAASFVLHNAPLEQQDCVAVQCLEGAGMYSLGRTNMSEFAFSGVGLNPHFGTPQNVWSQDEALIPGGSSSGSAIAVAQGLAPVGMGSDTSGSIRIPAALNGLVGFKPSSARISKQGVFPLSPSLDSVGVITHTIDDLLIVLDNFGFQSKNLSQQQKFIIPRNLEQMSIEPAIAKSFEASIKKLCDDGFDIQEQNIKAFDEAQKLFVQYGTLVAIEGYISLMPKLKSFDSKKIDPLIWSRLIQQKDWQAENLAHLLWQRGKLMRQLEAEIGKALLLMPTTTIRAVPIAKVANDLEKFSSVNKQILSLTMLGSFLDMPSLALPTGISDGVHPDSIMVSGCINNDEQVLTAGRALAKIFFNDEPLNNLRIDN